MLGKNSLSLTVVDFSCFADCLIAIGGSTLVQNNFVLNVQSFCANGDPFVPNTRGVTTISGKLTTVESSSPPIDPELKPSSPSSHANSSVPAPPISSTSVESAEIEPSMEDAPESTLSVDPPTSTFTPDPAEPSVVPPIIDSPTPASEILEVEPLSLEEANTVVTMGKPEAPASGVGVESHETLTHSDGPFFEIGPESIPAPSKEPYSATLTSDEPMTSPDSAPASEPSIPPSEPSVSLPPREVSHLSNRVDCFLTWFWRLRPTAACLSLILMTIQLKTTL